jgi:hypothetical protein
MFALTYVNSSESAHIRWSQTRFYMTFVMGAAMAVIMLSFMSRMYTSKRANAAIIGVSGLVFIVALWLVRSQTGIGDVAYMKGMIPHHSIAILTSEQAGISDVRVRELADGISSTQRREIEEMNWLLEDIATHGIASSQREADSRPVPDFGSGGG